MSHIKNLQNFDKVIAVCTGLGGNYNPGQQNLSVQELTTLLSNANAAYDSMKEARSDDKHATNHREVMFEGIDKLAGRVLSELKSSNVMEQTVADAREITRKLAGRKSSRDPVSTEPQAATETPKKRRAKGLDYASMADNFGILVMTVSEQPNYHPNMEDLKVQALQKKLEELHVANANVSTARAQLMNTKWSLNNMLYTNPGSVYDTMKGVKQQMKAIFGFSSEPRQAVTKIQISKPKTL
jgi:hypothetical protein